MSQLMNAESMVNLYSADIDKAHAAREMCGSGFIVRHRVVGLNAFVGLVKNRQGRTNPNIVSKIEHAFEFSAMIDAAVSIGFTSPGIAEKFEIVPAYQAYSDHISALQEAHAQWVEIFDATQI
jgi:hypothetical protein